LIPIKLTLLQRCELSCIGSSKKALEHSTGADPVMWHRAISYRHPEGHQTGANRPNPLSQLRPSKGGGYSAVHAGTMRYHW